MQITTEESVKRKKNYINQNRHESFEWKMWWQIWIPMSKQRPRPSLFKYGEFEYQCRTREFKQGNHIQEVLTFYLLNRGAVVPIY